MIVDSTLILVGVVFALGLVIMGHYTKMRIFNLFSVGVFLFLAIELSEFVALLIILIGLMLYELYYVFIGGQD